MKWYTKALGCRLNQAEIEDVSRGLLARGQSLTRDSSEADWGVLNTCAVTHVAVRKCRQLIHRLHRENPDMRIVITGCGTELPGAELGKLDGVTLVVRNDEKARLVGYLCDLVGFDEPTVLSPTGRLTQGHTRAFVKVQDGCDNACTYCFVTVARGGQRSRAPEEVVREVAMRLAEGYREVVLSGVHIGAYGRDSASQPPLPAAEGWSLARLVETVLTETGVPRLRLSSIEPWDVKPDLLTLWGDRRLCRQVHLPLQSGSDAVLRRMGRRYDRAGYLALVEEIRRRVTGVSITTDVMVGFPGETEDDFRETVEMVQRASFSRLHVFKYSARPCTRAAGMPDQVEPRVADRRSRTLIELGKDLACAFHRQYVGKDVDVLFEQKRVTNGGTVWTGLTDNYLRVDVLSEHDLSNVVARVRCERADARGLSGVLATV